MDQKPLLKVTHLQKDDQELILISNTRTNKVLSALHVRANSTTQKFGVKLVGLNLFTILSAASFSEWIPIRGEYDGEG